MLSGWSVLPVPPPEATEKYLIAVFNAPLLVSAGNGMLETCRVGGVTGNGNAYVFELHYSNAFGNVVCTVALNSRHGDRWNKRASSNNLYAFGVRIKLGFDSR